MGIIISKFRQNYNFLSNFYACDIEYEGRVYHSSEAAFQAAKCKLDAEKDNFINITPSTAKHMGRKVILRPDWEKVKNSIMLDIVYRKFTQNPELAQKLLNTGDATLVEGNSWNDTYWGVCNGRGQNRLGKILMNVRGILECTTQEKS